MEWNGQNRAAIRLKILMSLVVDKSFFLECEKQRNKRRIGPIEKRTGKAMMLGQSPPFVVSQGKWVRLNRRSGEVCLGITKDGRS